MNAEQLRIKQKDEHEKDWLKWGPYLSERQWGTVREDYSADSNAWEYTTYNDAIYRVWRWGEDGIAGISDLNCELCFSVAMWNGKDKMIKERLFGLSNPQGNHGEDVKELYYYLDNTPTHSYMKYLYKYPQSAFPYDELVEQNARRSVKEKEFEILDTEAFEKDKYFDVYIEYAKQSEEDILIKISTANRSSEAAEIHLLPTLFFKNKWSFYPENEKPEIKSNDERSVKVLHPDLGEYYFYFEQVDHQLFTENETDQRKIFDKSNPHPFTKGLFNDCLIEGNLTLAKQKSNGTKFSPYIKLEVPAKDTKTIRLRLSKTQQKDPFHDFEPNFYERVKECEQFYKDLNPKAIGERLEIQKLAFSGMLWNKQFYHYDVEKWLAGDAQLPNPPKERLKGRNSDWQHLRNQDILLMPDKWEYPWYASWDSAFHLITMAEIDLAFAKEQLLLFTKEWYMKPNGQIPAYEWDFGDINPPVQPWATLMINAIEKKKNGKSDVVFLKRMFNKLAINFTWWVNRLDGTQNNVFEGGFLGLDNIGVFDRSKEIPGNATLEQVDGTAWMALYCLSMLKISLEISKEDPSYQDMATKYFAHFIGIAESLNHIAEDFVGIWDEMDGFFYDKLKFPDGKSETVKVRSIVGMLALIAVLYIPKDTFDKLPQFRRSYNWFKENRMQKLKFPIIQQHPEEDGILLSLVPKDRIDILMKSLLDEDEFLSNYGIRSLSKIYKDPYEVKLEGGDYHIQYQPAESDSNMFGGNSNWRGPIWMPINHLLIDSLRELHKFYGDSVKYPLPSDSGDLLNFNEICNNLSRRLISIFEKNTHGNRPVNNLYSGNFKREHFSHLITFYEYFHGDNGRGVGASHQTGWTALVANLIQDLNA